jgi:hypothetical protein
VRQGNLLVIPGLRFYVDKIPALLGPLRQLLLGILASLSFGFALSFAVLKK